jgi:hypothetical protein
LGSTVNAFLTTKSIEKAYDVIFEKVTNPLTTFAAYLHPRVKVEPRLE